MLINYLKVGIRNILKYKSFSFINVFGLATAMSVCMLIIAMIADQKEYDQFHVNKDRIYRILSQAPGPSTPYASTPFPLAGTLKADYSITDESTHLIMGVGGDALYQEKTVEMRGFFADTSFFKVFSYDLEKGSKRHALKSPNSMIITGELADMLFSNENPIGKTVEFVDRGLHYLKRGKESPPSAWGNYTITGVIDMKNYRSHLKFDVLVSSSSMSVLQRERKLEILAGNWENLSKCFTYVLLPDKK
jgi:putative ABC transport system permease protein